MLQHIALEVKQSDIQDFYTDILGGKISRQFILNEGDAEQIFLIPKQIEVFKLCLNNLELELFVHESIEKDSLQHLCIQLKNAREIFDRASERNYWTHCRKSGDRETYFIKDRNRNMFELKN